MSHVGLGITEAYWEYRLKPWDMAAGVLVILSLLWKHAHLIVTFPNQF
jgi:fructose-1,6-bisphosphatase/inositol monophosphatase family enzyme